ncbi:MAG: hypothetical protein ACKVOU_10660 [Cytophagales bacterium]
MENNPSFDEIEYRLEKMLEKYFGPGEPIFLGDKWRGGKMILQPSDPSLKSKEVPIEDFFHKIVMLRDRLRVMEQKINANPKMTDDEKVEMQQYITRTYGTLTTFNVLFRHPSQQFVGQKSE